MFYPERLLRFAKIEMLLKFDGHCVSGNGSRPVVNWPLGWPGHNAITIELQ